MITAKFADQFLQGDVGREIFLVAMDKRSLRTGYIILKRGLDPNTTLSCGQTLLQAAFERKYVEFTKMLLRQGAKIDYATESIFNIALYCRSTDVQEKLSMNANPDEQDSHGNTVLHKLAEQIFNQQHSEVIDCLFSNGADFNIQNHRGKTPLHIANHEEICIQLIDNGASVNVCDNHGRTPLLKLLDDASVDKRETLLQRELTPDHFTKKYDGIIKHMLDHGVDVGHVDSQGNDAFTRCMNYKFSEILLLIQGRPSARETLTQLQLQAFEENKNDLTAHRVLLQHGGDLSWTTDKVSRHTALVNSWRPVISKQFIEAKKEEINIHNELGKTPLMEACEKDYVDVIAMLLQKGANVNAADKLGYTSLFRCKSVTSARLLLNFGASANVRTTLGEYPCMYISDKKIMKELLDAGANINVQDNMGVTVLIQAVASNHWDLARFLLTNDTQKSDPNVTDYAGQTALSVASRKGNIPMVNLLLENGTDTDIGTSSLIEAFTHGKIDTLEFLLDQGSSPNETNTFGETLLVTAAQSGAEYKGRALEMLKAREDLDVNVADEHGRSLLHLAAAHKPYLFTLVPFLIKQGAALTNTDAYGRTILHNWRPQTDSPVQLEFRQLLKEQVDVNHQDYNGHTAMHLTVMEADSEVRRRKCHELLKLGADLSVPDKNGLTVYHLAAHDEQLFDMLLKHAPRDFHGKELFLMHKLSGWFDTEDCILQALGKSDPGNKLAMSSDVNLVQQMKSISLTFYEQHSPSNLAGWVRNLTKHLCKVGHHQFFEERLSKDILCSYSEEKMAEMQEKANTVLSLFRDIASEIGKTDKMMEFTPYISGSCNEGTKVIQPDEMDMLCVLQKFEHIVFSQEGSPASSLVKIARKLGTTYHPFCQENTERRNRYNFILEQPRVFNYFYFLFSKALQNKEIWKKYPKLYRIQTDDMSHNSQSITDLSLVWHGDHFPFLEFSVDVVPAFSARGWLPEKALKHPLLERNGLLAIPKFRVEHIYDKDISYLFQASFERSEADLFHIMPVELKQAYMLAKIIKSMLPKIELLPPGMFFSSYLLKTCTFRIFQDHPEYKERLERFIASDKLSAALTQQPYDPQPLASVEDIMRWCKQIFIRLEQAMAMRNLDGFFLPGYNLLGHKVYEENYRPRLMAQICRTMLLDPNVEPGAWKHLAQQGLGR